MKKVIYVLIVLIFFITCFGCATTPQRLNLAVLRGHHFLVKRLIEEGADVNAKEGDYGYTALMLASERGQFF